MKLFLILFILLTLFNCCQNKPNIKETSQVFFSEINNKEIEIIGTKKIEEFAKGVSFEKKELYILQLPKTKGKYMVTIADIFSGDTRKEVELSRGSFQSPVDFYRPTYIEFINGRYYIVDQSDKIVVFDGHMKYIYSSMFYKLRYFFDFFSSNNQIFFVIGSYHQYGKTMKCITNLYQLKENKKPQLVQELNSANIESLALRNSATRKYYYVGIFWPSHWGFEKKGNIYYCTSNQEKIYVYSLKKQTTSIVDISYLTAKKYSREDAEHIGYYKTNGWEKKMRRKVVYLPYPDNIYHFGLYDVGQDKIGIVGDIDLKTMKFRLDIIKIGSYQYKESIWLPIGIEFTQVISTDNMGYLQAYINVEKGIYIWHDLVGEDLEYTVKITRFKIKKGQTENEN